MNKRINEFKYFENIKKVLFGFFLVLLLTSFTYKSFAQETRNELLEKKISIQISQETFIYTLGKLSQKYDIPFGLEKSSNHTDVPKIDLKVEEKSLEDVLNLLVEQETEYKWVLVDGVINIVPIKTRDKFISKLLDIELARLEYPRENNSFSLRENILALPEVKLLMNSESIEYADLLNTPLSSSQPIFTEEKDNLIICNTNLRKTFNWIIRESNHRTWVVEMVGKNKNKLLISF